MPDLRKNPSWHVSGRSFALMLLATMLFAGGSAFTASPSMPRSSLRPAGMATPMAPAAAANDGLNSALRGLGSAVLLLGAWASRGQAKPKKVVVQLHSSKRAAIFEAPATAMLKQVQPAAPADLLDLSSPAAISHFTSQTSTGCQCNGSGCNNCWAFSHPAAGCMTATPVAVPAAAAHVAATAMASTGCKCNGFGCNNCWTFSPADSCTAATPAAVPSSVNPMATSAPAFGRTTVRAAHRVSGARRATRSQRRAKARGDSTRRKAIGAKLLPKAALEVAAPSFDVSRIDEKVQVSMRTSRSVPCTARAREPRALVSAEGSSCMTELSATYIWICFEFVMN